MSDGFAYIDILFFAMVAAFIALRLRSVLGRKTGHERRRTGLFPGSSRANGAGDAKKGADNVVSLPDRSEAAVHADPGIADLADGKVKTGLTQIRVADPSFQLNEFLLGARAAFEMIVEAYAAGNKETLRPLLADAELRDTIARVTVRFTSEQVNVLRDAEGQVIDGDPGSAEEVIDLWTFERDTRSQDPNWSLVETSTPS